MKTINCLSLLVSIVILSNMDAFAQSNEYLCRNDEKLVYGFQTRGEKLLSVCVSKDEKYIVYRFGTKKKIEMEYPKNKENSWQLFRYDFYLRGGGPANAGLDLNYLSFINDNIRYRVYYEYDAEENTPKTGVRVINLETKKMVDIPGILKTVKGSLVTFRFDYQGKITTGEDVEE